MTGPIVKARRGRPPKVPGLIADVEASLAQFAKKSGADASLVAGIVAEFKPLFLAQERNRIAAAALTGLISRNDNFSSTQRGYLIDAFGIADLAMREFVK
jgi:hypothetical protein